MVTGNVATGKGKGKGNNVVNSAPEVQVTHTVSSAPEYPRPGWLQYTQHSAPTVRGSKRLHALRTQTRQAAKAMRALPVVVRRAAVLAMPYVGQLAMRRKQQANRKQCMAANAIHAQLRKLGQPRNVCKAAALAVLPQRTNNVQQPAAQQTAQPAPRTTTKSAIPVLHTRATAAHAGAVTFSGNAAQLGKGNGGKHGATRAGDLPWCACKVAVLQGLLAAGATDASRCVTAQTVVNATNGALASAAQAANNRAPLTTLVRHFAYHAGANAAPWTVTVTNAFGRAHGFYITPAGVQALQAYLGNSASA